MENLQNLKKKLLVFRFLIANKNENKNYKKLNCLNTKILDDKRKRKFFNILKSLTFLQKTKDFEERVNNKTENDLNLIEDELAKQKENLMNLIIKAEEKLKHENRKKIQTKLQLDQMVLRGISALNMKALSLSQNSLNEVVKSDYTKEIDKKYISMGFPDTKSTLRLKKTNK